MDIKKWLMEDMGFSDAEATEMAPKFKADGVSKLERVTTRAAEYDSKETEIAASRADLKDANDRLNEEMKEWALLSSKEKSEATALQASIEKLQMEGAAMRHRLTTLATETGRDPKAVLAGIDEPAKPKEEPKVAPVDTSQFVDRASHSAVALFNLELPAQLQFIADEHQALFGKRLDTREIVAEIRARSGKKDAVIDPVKIWEEKHGVVARREAVAHEKYETDIKAAELRGEERANTNRAIPSTTPAGRHSPAFGLKNSEGVVTPRTSALQRPQPGATVRSAASALVTGKYRQASR